MDVNQLGNFFDAIKLFMFCMQTIHLQIKLTQSRTLNAMTALISVIEFFPRHNFFPIVTQGILRLTDFYLFDNNHLAKWLQM